MSSTQTLRGWKRILGYAEIRKDLQTRSLPCSPEHVCAWLRKSTVQFSAKNMAMLLRVFDRMTAAGHGCLDSLEKLESEFQAEHFFTKTGILQMVCERTSTPKNTLLQNSLLAWVVQGLTLRALTPDDGKLMHLEPGAPRVPWKFVQLGFFLGGAASFERHYLQVFFPCFFCFFHVKLANQGRDICFFVPLFFGKFFPFKLWQTKDEVLRQMGVELAIRRVIHYLSAKFGNKEGAQARLCDCFGSYTTYFSTFREGSEERKQFLSTCTSSELEAAMFCDAAMSGSKVIHSILANALTENWLLPAEVLMQKREWVEDGIVDVEELLKDPPQEDAVQAAMEEVAQTEEAAVTPVETPDHTPTKARKEEIEDEVPDAVPEEEKKVSVEPDRREHFRVLTLPDFVADLFMKVSRTTFERTVHHAKLCADLTFFWGADLDGFECQLDGLKFRIDWFVLWLAGLVVD